MSNDEQKDSAAPPPSAEREWPEELAHFRDPKAVFLVHNTVRGRHNRTLRAQSPVHGGMRQHIGGEHRLVRGRPLELTQKGLERHMKELLEKEKLGLIEVKTRDGRRIDLSTGHIVGGPPPAVNAVPNIRPDSVAHDVNLGGHIMTQFPGDVPVQDTDPNKVPDLFKSAGGENTEEDFPPPGWEAAEGQPPADPLTQADVVDTGNSPEESTEGTLEGSTGSVPPHGGKKKGKSNR